MGLREQFQSARKESHKASLGYTLFGPDDDAKDEAPNMAAELARIEALYNTARTQGTAAITQDFQAQRGELAESQAARGILRSGVSQLGLARLGASRQQALAAFNAQLSASQAGGQTNLMNALMGRQDAFAERKRRSQSEFMGTIGGLAGAYFGGRGGAAVGSNLGTSLGSTPNRGGYNYSGSNMVAPQSFYQRDFYGGGYGQDGLSGGQMLGQYQATSNFGGSSMRTPFY